MSTTPAPELTIAPHVRAILAELGEDPDREGLLKTPERVDKSYRFLTRGYSETLDEVIGDALFEESHESMILVKDIEFYSLCEHHMLPFFGRAHVAYIPHGRIMGLSKAARIVDMFARRLQVQERLTDQIADAIMRCAAAARRRRGHRGIPPLHDDARGREAELAHRDQRAPGHLPRRPADAQRVPPAGSRRQGTSERSPGRSRSSPAHPAASAPRRRRRLRGAGARVVRVARSLRAGLHDGFADFPCDLTDVAAWKATAAHILAEVGVPDIVVSNAGAFALKLLHETTQEDFDAQLDINLRAPFAVARALLPPMRAAGRGTFIHVGSVADHTAFPENAAYAASKFGLRGLHEVLVAEYRGTGIRLSLLSPGPTDTDVWNPVDPGSCAAPAQSRQHASTRRCGRGGALHRHPSAARSR